MLANAFALEYIRAKKMLRLTDAVTVASREFARLAAVYGERHPNIVKARTEVEAARVRLQNAANLSDVVQSDFAAAEGITLAEPSMMPSSPKGRVILGLTMITALASGVGIALWLERRDTGRRNEAQLLARIGVPCLGMVPRLSDRAGTNLSRDTAVAFRAIAAGAGLIGVEGLAIVAMITSTLPREGASECAAGLAEVLISEGRRVLLFDTLSQRHKGDGVVSLEDVLASSAHAEAFFEASKTGQLAKLRPAWQPKGQRHTLAMAQGAFRQLLADARKRFDVILIAAPPVTLFAETVLIGHNADVTLHVVQWNRTALQAVGSAIQQLRDGAVRVVGIVLTDVNASRWGNS
jgi:Mrp family chromosome partitioning ATPase